MIARQALELAATIFRAKLASRQIHFKIRSDGGDWVAPDKLWTTAPLGPRNFSANSAALWREAFFCPYMPMT